MTHKGRIRKNSLSRYLWTPLYIVEMNNIMEVDENETFKIKKKLYLISMVAAHNFIETLTHISHRAYDDEITLMIEDQMDNFDR